MDAYLDRNYAPLADRVASLVRHEEAALKQLEHIEKNLFPPLSETAIKVFKGYAEYLRGDVVKWVMQFDDPELKRRFASANPKLAKAAEQVAARLAKRELPRADQGWVLGVERYKRLLDAQEGLSQPLATPNQPSFHPE